MKESLQFRAVAFDSALLPQHIPAGASYSFFADNPEIAGDSVLAKIEERLVSWLFRLQITRELITTELGATANAFWALKVTDPIIEDPNTEPGDVDVLICESEYSHQAIALECKRVKVEAIDMGYDKVNKISQIGKGVWQANGLRELGFHRTYLAILVSVYGRNRDEYNFLARGPVTYKQIYDFPRRDKLHNDVGVVFIEVDQPTGKDIDKAAVVGICVDKEAEQLEQPRHLTNRIKELLTRKSR